MVMGIKPGPISYANKMTPAEWNDYDAKLALIESMEVSGELVRGWKTKVVAQIPYTFAMVSGVLSKRIISPPVLDMIILRIGARGRSRANFDYHERIEQLQATQLQVGELIDQQQVKLTEAAEQYEERVRALAAAHQRDMDKLTAHHEILQGRYAELATEIENLRWKWRRSMARGTLNNLVYRLAAGIECANCGSTHARCQLHHRDPATKLFDPSSRPPGTNLGKLLAEIMKCVPLCGRCHMDHHDGRAPKREWVSAKIDWELIGMYLATRGEVDRYSADYIETGVWSEVLPLIPLQYQTQIVML